jgi:RND family efflux transporter MFP subunit
MKIKKLYILLCLLSTLPISSEEFIGIIKPLHDIKIAVSLDGIVESILVKEGSIVKEGEDLFTLESQLQELELNRRKVIWKDKSQLNASFKTRDIQKSLLTSTRKLYHQTKAVSKHELQLLESKYYTLIGDIKMRQENEKKEEIEYKIAFEMLEKYTIKSPINGVITELALQRGEWAKVGTPYIRIVNTDSCFIDINIDEVYSSKLTIGDKIDFLVSTKSISADKKGEIIFISPVADMASALVRIKIKFSNIQNRVTPGLSATISIDEFLKEMN